MIGDFQPSLPLQRIVVQIDVAGFGEAVMLWFGGGSTEVVVYICKTMNKISLSQRLRSFPDTYRVKSDTSPCC